MAAPTIPNGEEHFFPIIYEGTGTGRRVGKFVPFTNNGTIANSVIYNRADTPKLARTPGSNGNRKTFTISVWYKPTDLGTDRTIISADTSASGTNYAMLKLNTNNKLFFYSGTAGGGDVISTRTFEDSSKFYHFMAVVDTTQSTASNRVKLYVDGDLITSLDSTSYPSQDGDTNFNSTSYPMAVGSFNSLTSICVGGNLAEFNFVDGTALTPSTFGVTDTSTGRWIPKALTGITYGTNGFRLTFADSSAFGDDTSGNGNDFTATNLASTDQTTDSPTQNFITFGNAERFFGTQQTTEQGGLTIYAASGSGYPGVSAGKEIPQSGKWYWEVKLDAVGAVQGITNPTYGVIDRNIKEITGFSTSSQIDQQAGGMGGTFWNGFKFGGLLSTATDFTIGSYVAADNDYVLFAFDMDEGKAWWGFNDSSAGSSVVWFANDGGTDGNPSTGANPTVTFNPRDHRFVPIQQFYAPGSGYSARYNFNFGSKAFAFTAPTGFSGLSQNNFPETDKGISGLVWVKNRDATLNHVLYDSSRGVHNYLNSNTTGAQGTDSDGLTKFLKGGFATEDAGYTNTSGNSFVGWNWVANSGTTASNTDGSITSTVQANTTAGFSIVQFTGTGANATVGHGLSSAPEWIVSKNLATTASWAVYHKDMTSSAYTLFLDTTAAQTSSSTMWNSTAPTSSVINVGANFQSNGSSQAMVHYCWHSVDGFSKFGKYTGNGNADGPFIYTGFKPAWLMIKRTNSAANWYIIDTKRDPINPTGQHNINADTTSAESSNAGLASLDILSNGFKNRQGAGTGINDSGSTYIYMAFAKHPFVGDGTSPVTAR